MSDICATCKQNISDCSCAVKMGSDTCPICRQNISDCCCAVKNGRELALVLLAMVGSDTCPICRQNISDCCCAVKNRMASDTCPICRQNISDCCCAVKNGRSILQASFLAIPSDTCPICRQNISDCCCAVKNGFIFSLLVHPTALTTLIAPYGVTKTGKVRKAPLKAKKVATSARRYGTRSLVK